MNFKYNISKDIHYLKYILHLINFLNITQNTV